MSVRLLFSGPLRRGLIGLYALLLLANLGAWAWAALLFHRQPALLGTALLAYGFGLRHAVDADHIAAIDNVTRKLMQDGQRPLTVGFWFALGHSAVVILATAAIAATASSLAGQFAALHAVGSTISTAVSALFLLLIAAMNVVILREVWLGFRAAQRGEQAGSLDPLLEKRGLLARLFRPLFRLVRASWHMAPLGFLFGLGFDTATEVGLLGMSATAAAKGVAIWSIMVFPALFTAGMSLVDTTDGIVMLGAYDWALVQPARKLAYNLAITAVSVLVAVLIGGVEALGLIGDRMGLSGWPWDGIGTLNDHFNGIGFGVLVLFIIGWIGAMVAFRYRPAHLPARVTADGGGATDAA